MINEEWIVYEENSSRNGSGLSEDELAGLTTIAESDVTGALTYGVVVASLAIAANSHVNGYRQGYEDGASSISGNETQLKID